MNELIKEMEKPKPMKTKVLNVGSVELVEWMGGDKAVIRNARRCYRSEDKTTLDKDRMLIQQLISKGHMSPFEAMVFTFDVKAPLFVARQWMRHRMGSFNEESLRYCTVNQEYYVPGWLGEGQRSNWIAENNRPFEAYNDWIRQGMSKEQARSLLPLGLYTRFYWTANGRSLINFLEQRMDKSAQKEIRDYAEAISVFVEQVAPITFGAWLDGREQK